MMVNGRLNPLAECMLATELMYYEDCVCVCGNDFIIQKRMRQSVMVAGFKSTDEDAANWIQQIGLTIKVDWKRSNVQVVARSEVNDLLSDMIVNQGQIIETLKSEAAREKAESKRRYEESQKQFQLISRGLAGLEGLISDWIRAQDQRVSPASPRKRSSLAVAEVTSPGVAGVLKRNYFNYNLM